MKLLRLAPKSSGYSSPSSIVSSCRRCSTSMFAAGVLPKPMPGSKIRLSFATPASSAMAQLSRKKSCMASMMSARYSVPSWLCMTTTGAWHSAATRAIAPRSSAAYCKPQMSLRMSAPSSTAARAVSALNVSMEIGTGIFGAICSKKGASRSISSAADTGTKPGRDDSAPTSMIAAPSSTIESAWSSA